MDQVSDVGLLMNQYILHSAEAILSATLNSKYDPQLEQHLNIFEMLDG